MSNQRFIVEQADRDWVSQIGWRCVRDVLACKSDDVAAVSRSSDVVRVPVDPALGGPAAVYVKRYHYDRRAQRIKQMFRGTLFGRSRARVEHEFLKEMCRRKIPTVRPIAYGDFRRGAFLRASVVITEGKSGYQSLDVFALTRMRRNILSAAERRALIHGLAVTVRRMHDAGVRHGGLFMRNILIRSTSNGCFDFELLDPDTRGRMFPTRIPEADLIADLAELVASAMGLGLRGGLRTLMREYFDVSRLSPGQRQVVSKIVDQARKLAPLEQRRMAATEAIDWFRGRVSAIHKRSQSFRQFATLDEFFEALGGAGDTTVQFSSRNCAIRFAFKDSGDRTVVIDGSRVAVVAHHETQPDLTVRSDRDTVLAVMSGHASSYARLRAGRLRLAGDTRLLSSLVGLIDAATSAPKIG